MWEQTYDPVGSALLSTVIASLPVLLLLALLGVFHVAAHKAAAAGLIAAAAIALLVYGMPADSLAAASIYGAGFGLLPIGWIVFAAVFLYNLTVDSGQFEIVKDSVAALSNDRRIQVILIAFSFGAFLEGAAGFGTPVAISAALLMGLGFTPLHAAGLALIANTSPVAFGALGTPIITLANVTGAGPEQQEKLAYLYSAMAGRQLPFFSLIVPVWLVWVMGGFRAVRGVWPALVVSGGVFAVVQHFTAEYTGPFIVDVAGGLASLVATALLLKVWSPQANPEFQPPTAGGGVKHHGVRAITYAWMPWVILSAIVFVWGWRKKDLEGPMLSPAFAVPALHKQVAKGAEVRDPLPAGMTLSTAVEAKVPAALKAIESAEYKFNWLSATGTGIFVASILSAVWLGIGPRRFLGVFASTLYKVRTALLTIVCMLALGYVTKYSGQDVTLGLAFTHTGLFYPFFSAMLGWLGVALTGSDTSSNVLFGNLQNITGRKLVEAGILPLTGDQAQVLLCTANSTGGVMGKMIDAQSIVVAAAATGEHGSEGRILRFVFLHSLVLAALVGVLIMIQAYWWTSSVPG